MNMDSAFFSNIKDFIEEHRKQTVIAAAILIFMTVAAVVILAVSDMTSGDSKEMPQIFRELNLSDDLLLPSDSIKSDPYIKSRITKKNWSKDEASKWFTKPDAEQLRKLRSSNNKIINEILGATP